MNPAFKRKKESGTEEPASNNKVLKTEDLKGKEESTEASSRKEPKKKDEKSEFKKEPKHKVETSSKEEEDEPMEVD